MDKKLQETHAALLEELKKLKELKAEKFEKYRAKRISQVAKSQIVAEDMEGPETEEDDEEEYVVMEEFYDRIGAVVNLVYSMSDNIWNGFYQLSSQLDKHCCTGHLPALTAGQLEKLLKAAGAENDFQVEKKTVWAGRNLIAEIKQVKS